MGNQRTWSWTFVMTLSVDSSCSRASSVALLNCESICVTEKCIFHSIF